MVSVDTLIHLSIVILLMRLFCILLTKYYDPMLITFNPHHVSQHDVISNTDTVSTVPTPSVLYHYPNRSASHLSALLTELHPPSLSGLVVSPTNEVWLSFDFIVHYFVLFNTFGLGSNVTHFMLETSPLHFRIATTFHSSPTIRFTTLSHVSIIYIDSIIVDHSILPLILALNLAIAVIFNSFPVLNSVIAFMTVTP